MLVKQKNLQYEDLILKEIQIIFFTIPTKTITFTLVKTNPKV